MSVLNREDRAFLQRQRVAHLATADLDGVPHVIPIVYALVADSLYFVVDEKPKRTKVGLKRLRNIESNPAVSVVVDLYDEDWSRLRYLLIHGRARIVDDRALYTRVRARLRRRYAPYETMALKPETNPMVCISPVRCHRWSAT